jgi:hypothetical protein
MRQFISRTFYDAAAASRAIDQIIVNGYPAERINIIMSSETQRRISDGSAAGAVQRVRGIRSGGAGGALAAIVTRIASAVRTPAPLFIAGPAAAAVAPPGRTRDVRSALAGLRMPRTAAARLEDDIEAGAIIVGVDADEEDRATLGYVLRASAARTVLETASPR